MKHSKIHESGVIFKRISCKYTFFQEMQVCASEMQAHAGKMQARAAKMQEPEGEMQASRAPHPRAPWPRCKSPAPSKRAALRRLRPKKKASLNRRIQRRNFFRLFFQEFLNELLNPVSVSKAFDFRHHRSHEFSHVLHAAFNT